MVPVLMIFVQSTAWYLIPVSLQSVPVQAKFIMPVTIPHQVEAKIDVRRHEEIHATWAALAETITAAAQVCL